MRFVIAHPGPAFSVRDLFVGWSSALSAAGQHVIEFPLDAALTFYSAVLFQPDGEEPRRALTSEQAKALAIDRLYATVLKTRPHVLMIISGFYVYPELLQIVRAAGVRVVVVHTESPYEDERQLRLAPYADINLVNDPTNIDRFLSCCMESHYVPHAYRPEVHHPGPSLAADASDLVFVGTGYPSRIEFLEAMNLDGLDVSLAGNWQALAENSPLHEYLIHPPDHCLDNEETAELYRSAAVGLNLYRREAQAAHLVAGWACGPREVEMAACGLFFLRDPRGESDELFASLPTFAGPEDASEEARWWLTHERQRENAARRARAAIEGRTFDAHASWLLRLLDA